jgi:hypothetical protein
MRPSFFFSLPTCPSSPLSLSPPPPHSRRPVARKCGILGIHRASGDVAAELYEGLLMLQHRGQDR